MAKKEIKVPDLGNFKNVPVLEVYISPGDTLSEGSPVISLESEKAVMDVPSPLAGRVLEVKVTTDNRVSEGDLLAVVETAETTAPATETTPAGPDRTASPGPARETLQGGDLTVGIPGGTTSVTPAASRAGTTPGSVPSKPAEAPAGVPSEGGGDKRPPTYHASPSVRRFARELGVDLGIVKGTGPKGRIQKEDVEKTVSAAMKSLSSGGPELFTGIDGLPSAGQVSIEDFQRFGPVEEMGLNRIKRISGPRIHRNWIGIPQVTQFDESDVTELEEFRENLNSAKDSSVKLSILPFLVKASVSALKKYPLFNSSIDQESQKILLKRYYNIGIAVNTPSGLVVPVIKDADTKGITDLAEELKELGAKAREDRLTLAELQGSSFTISSLGGIGGTGFTPIVNFPEAAILGVSKIAVKPVWRENSFEPRKILPFSVSYDHRIIDGAQGAEFCRYLSGIITDIRRVLL